MALLLEEGLREGIAERLNMMIRDARQGDGMLVDLVGDTIEAELRRIITPLSPRRDTQRDRTVPALQMGLTVAEVRRVGTLVIEARQAFNPENRQPAVMMLGRALAHWQQMQKV